MDILFEKLINYIYEAKTDAFKFWLLILIPILIVANGAYYFLLSLLADNITNNPNSVFTGIYLKTKEYWYIPIIFGVLISLKISVDRSAKNIDRTWY